MKIVDVPNWEMMRLRSEGVNWNCKVNFTHSVYTANKQTVT